VLSLVPIQSSKIATKTAPKNQNNTLLTRLNMARDLRLILDQGHRASNYVGKFVTRDQEFPITYNAKTKLLQFTSSNNVSFCFQKKTNPYKHLSSALESAVARHNSKL
jgi:hypothetical protein